MLWSAGNEHVAAAIAFSLALFSHVLNHTIMRLQSALYDLEHPQPLLPTVPSSGHIIFIVSVIIFIPLLIGMLKQHIIPTNNNS